MGGLDQKLQRLHIVVTRPLAQAEPWAKRLNELGARVSQVPLLDIVTIGDAVRVQAIKNSILNFDLYNKVIFVSQNAVTYGFEWLDNYWPQLPVGVDFFAVGETTARAILAQGVIVKDLAQTQSGAMNSETLLQAPELQQVAGEKILIMRGLGGRTHLGDVLTTRGARVDYCELYERHLPGAASAQFALILKLQTLKHSTKKSSALHVQQKNIAPHTVVTLHSGDALTNLIAILKKILAENQIEMPQLILLVPGERVAEQAIDAGFKTIFTAENATEASMLERLLDIAASFENQIN